MGHEDVLRLRVLGNVAVRVRGAVGHGLAHRAGADHFALFVAADQHFFIAVGRVGVLHLATLIVGGHGNTHAMQLPVHEQGRDHGEGQQQRSITTEVVTAAAEPLLICFDNIVHSDTLLLTLVDQREMRQGPYP